MQFDLKPMKAYPYKIFLILGGDGSELALEI